ncbi:hypothetical protein T492DRAFT_991637 [Pavlovales sp. CCMP2436]|nr:hypothetical protein T492DRAFT_991637 [Pavlovales sp. CCMP2436]
MAEMQQEARPGRYGRLQRLPASSYAQEVNGADEGVWVVLALVLPGEPSSTRLVNALELTAQHHPAIKFLSMVGAEAIPNYPAANCPTVLVYRSDVLLGQFIGPRSVGLPADKASSSVESDENTVLGALSNVIDDFKKCS